MIYGIGIDICDVNRWNNMIERSGQERCCQRILSIEESNYLLESNPNRLAERLAGRWALREAFGKSLGVGLTGWNWKELRYVDGKVWVEGELKSQLNAMNINRLHASITHDNTMAVAMVVLEN